MLKTLREVRYGCSRLKESTRADEFEVGEGGKGKGEGGTHSAQMVHHTSLDKQHAE